MSYEWPPANSLRIRPGKITEGNGLNWFLEVELACCVIFGLVQEPISRLRFMLNLQ